MLLTVVDYGVGNLRSIAKSIEKANSENNERLLTIYIANEKTSENKKNREIIFVFVNLSDALSSRESSLIITKRYLFFS